MKKAIPLMLLLALPLVALGAPTPKILLRKDVQNPAIGAFGTCRITDDGKVSVKNDGTGFIKSETVDVAQIQSLIGSVPSEKGVYSREFFEDLGDRKPEVRVAAYRSSNGKNEVVVLTTTSCIKDGKGACTQDDVTIQNSSAQAQELLQIVNKACR